jgi:hypothetical protein
MREEHALRRPGFRPGLQLRLADGQVWSLPVPEARDDMAWATPAWDDSSYRAILRAIAEAEDSGELFRAELALVIHLLRWNYAVDQDHLQELLDDRGAGRPRADLSEALLALASAHLEPAVGRPPVVPSGEPNVRISGPVRTIFHAAWQLSTRGGGRTSGARST